MCLIENFFGSTNPSAKWLIIPKTFLMRGVSLWGSVELTQEIPANEMPQNNECNFWPKCLIKMPMSTFRKLCRVRGSHRGILNEMHTFLYATWKKMLCPRNTLRKESVSFLIM